MKVIEAIVLAGGLGTRLQKIIPGIPKPMALINGRPFLEYLLNFLNAEHVTKVVLSVGHKYEVIYEYFKTKYKDIEIEYSVESTPLGTGGGIKKAADSIRSKDFLVLNGDTIFDINISELYDYHLKNRPGVTIALKRLSDNSRYGSVDVDNDLNVRGFIEKKSLNTGFLINGGIYVINRKKFNSACLSGAFSFEKDFLEKYYNIICMKGLVFDNYFLDIGVPEDFKLAQTEFGKLKY